jgi:hypothetical protein
VLPILYLRSRRTSGYRNPLSGFPDVLGSTVDRQALLM